MNSLVEKALLLELAATVTALSEAERAARRKWELRLRVRCSVSSLERLQGINDRLFQREDQLEHAIYLSDGGDPRSLPGYEYRLISKIGRRWPIAGPRGVLP